jgi:ParB/RepB/Spo0J family partition protein
MSQRPVGRTVIFHVPIDNVRPNPNNPRRGPTDLTKLVASIKEFGVLEPPFGTTVDGRTFTLVSGERRLAAARLAGRETFPVIPTKAEDAGRTMAKALTENIHHEPMAPMDEARAIQMMLGDGYEIAEIAKMLGHSIPWAQGRLNLLRLPAPMQDEVVEGTLPLGKATEVGRLLKRRETGAVVTNARAVTVFTTTHPQASIAKQRCDDAGHPKLGRSGAACQGCWEWAIRADERQTVLNEELVGRELAEVGTR